MRLRKFDNITKVVREHGDDKAKEKCTCQAPRFITGCENAIATKEDGVDECTCTTGECPWVRHTGTFL